MIAPCQVVGSCIITSSMDSKEWYNPYKVDRSISGPLRVLYELKWVLWCKFFGERRKYRRGIVEVEELISVDACVHNNFWKQKCAISL